jgi:hypothetical protein
MCGMSMTTIAAAGPCGRALQGQPGGLRALRAHLLSLYRVQPAACWEGLGPGGLPLVELSA